MKGLINNSDAGPPEIYNQKKFRKIDKNQDNFISQEEFQNQEGQNVDLQKPAFAFFGILGVILVLLICSGTFYGVRKYVDRKKENIKKNKD